FQVRREVEDAPQAVDDGRHSRQQLDQDRQRPPQPPRRELTGVKRRRDRDRHADQQRERRGDQGADDERQRSVVPGARVPVVVEDEAEDALLFEGGSGFTEELYEEE